MSILGRIHSFQSLGTVDGPGVRFVVFMQGCNLRCACCHNPDTWDLSGGNEYAASQVFEKVVKFREYFSNGGGITVSGGEPLLQAQFVTELFTLCKQNGINTCLDTSGNALNDDIIKLLSVTDRVLLDIKYTSDEDYRNFVGCDLQKPIEFLEYLNSVNIPTTLRQVIISGINDNEQNIFALKNIASNYAVVDKIELLPFKTICQTKYDNLGIRFRFGHITPTTSETIKKLQKLL